MSDFKVPQFTPLASGPVSISNLYPARVYQASRCGASKASDVMGFKSKTDDKGVTTLTPLPEWMDLVSSLLEKGWDRAERMVTVKVTNKADIAALKREYAADLAEFLTLALWKGDTGTFAFHGEDVVINRDDCIASWSRAFPKTVKVKVGKKTVEMDRFESPDFEAVLAANRGLTALVLIYNTVAIKAGREDLVVTEIDRECRDYGTAQNRDDASIYLNESVKLGKLAPNLFQRLGATIALVARGLRETDLSKVFAAGKKERGKIQAHFKVGVLLRLISFLLPDQMLVIKGASHSPADAHGILKGWILDGTIVDAAKEGKNLEQMNALFNRASHKDGLEEQFGTDTTGHKAWTVNRATQLDMVETKVHVREHPELVQDIVDFFVGKQEKGFVLPLFGTGSAAPVKSLASKKITDIAANVENGHLLTLLNTIAGKTTGYDLDAAVKAVDDHIKAAGSLFLVDLETGELIQPALTQDDMPELSAALASFKKKGSGRSKRSG